MDMMTKMKPPRPRPNVIAGVTVYARGIPPTRMNSVEAATSSVYRASVCPRASAMRPPVTVLGFCAGGWRIRDAIVCTDAESTS